MQNNLREFKKKFSSLIRTNKQNQSIDALYGIEPEDAHKPSSTAAADEAALISQIRERSKELPLNNPHRESEILSSIDPVYYSDQNFEPSIYELKKLPEMLDVNEINRARECKKEQLDVVMKNISDLIQHHHPSYSAELQKVTELQHTLSAAYSSCRTARTMIDIAQQNFTIAGLKILGLYRKRQLLFATSEVIKRLKTLRETDQRLRELFEEENYTGAILMCMECQQAAATFSQYHCISDLSKKLDDTLQTIEVRLDNALASTALCVDLERYGRVFAAYEMLRKVQVAADSLVQHFLTVLASSSESIVKSYQNDGRNDQVVPPNQFGHCLRELLTVFWRIWFGYHTIILWHAERPVFPAEVNCSDEHADYMETKLQQGLHAIWEESSRLINSFIQCNKLDGLSFDEITVVIDLARKIVDIGQRHFADDSTELMELLREKCAEYVKSYHRRCIDELTMFLETEVWETVPVKRNFCYKDVPEFKCLDKIMDCQPPRRSVSSDGERVNLWEFMTEAGCVNPFEQVPKTSAEDMAAADVFIEDEDSDVDEELKRDFIEEAGMENSNHRGLLKRQNSFKFASSMQPFICSTSLNLLRLWGRCLNIAVTLPVIAFDMVNFLSELFDFYFFAIYRYFGVEASEYTFLPSKLQQAIIRMEDEFVNRIIPHNNACSAHLDASDSFFGLRERVVGVESLIFVAKQLDSLRPILERLVPTNKLAFINQFFTQTVDLAPELRRPVYGAMALKIVRYDYYVKEISDVNWDISELKSQHNDYVESLTKELDGLRSQLLESSRNAQIPKEAYQSIWDCSIYLVTRLLVDGYSRAKKCANEGRAWMQLDFQQLLRAMERISGLRPLPYREHVETYVKAYYLPENKLEEWISTSKEYPPRQLVNLLNVTSQVSKRTRQRLTAFLLGTPDAT